MTKIKYTVTIKTAEGKQDRQWFKTAKEVGAAVAKLVGQGATVHVHQGEL